MKRSPKYMNLLALILLIATLCQPVGAIERLPVSEETQSSSLPSADSSVTPPAGSADAILPEQPQTDPLYTALYSCIDKGESHLRYPTTAALSNEYLQELLLFLLDECPEFFYLNELSVTSTIYKNADGSVREYVYEFKPLYTFSTQNEIIAAKQEWQTLLGEILQTVDPEMSDLEKALLLHDYLCINFSYDSTLTVADSYRFLLEKTGVCEAYADTYSLLLTALGIENCFAVSPSMNHVWNVIKIDGEWYHVDVTWDDPMSSELTDQPGRASHTAFLRSDKGMRAIDHSDWSCKVACTSEKYDHSFFSEINSEIVSDGDLFYAVSNTQNAILRCNFDTMTAEPIVDLSGYRWYVWGSSTFWNACFSNLYCDGEWLYFSTPTSIEAYDIASGKTTTVCQYREGKGYLYSMRYTDHHLVCTVSTKPSVHEGEFSFKTRHRYGEPKVDGIFVTATCTECTERDHRILPPADKPFAVTASTRPTADVSGSHDIRIVFAVDRTRVKTLGQLEYVFELLRTDGSKDTLRFHSVGDNFSSFQSYSSISVGSDHYYGQNGQPLYGFFVSGVKDKSWTSVSFTVKDASGKSLYHGTLGYDKLVRT